MAQERIGNKAVGSLVKIREGDALAEYRIVHQGKPSSLYDASCDGTWLLREALLENRQWHTSAVNKYESSAVHSFLNGEFLNTIQADIRAKIKQIKLPYRKNGGNTGSNQSGANGLSCRVFLPSSYELGIKDQSGVPADGACLSYFTGLSNNSETKRTAYLDGSRADWWTRSPDSNTADDVRMIRSSGATYYYMATLRLGVRPALVVPSSLYVLADGSLYANQDPVISGSNGSLGTFGETAPSYRYTVTDEDKDTVTVTEKLDNTVLHTYNVTLGSQNTLTIPAATWRNVLNGSHTLTITATDPDGASSTRTQTFTKSVASLGFTLAAPMAADAMPDRCVVNIQGSFPAGSALKVEICNNANDASPAWEEITQKALTGQKHFFTNKTKTAAQWGVNLRVSLSRGGASGACYVSSIGGNFE